MRNLTSFLALKKVRILSSELEKKVKLGAVFSYTLTGAVNTERTENIVEQSDWLLESKVYC